MMNRVRNQPEYVFDDGTFFLKDEHDNIILGTQSIWMMLDIEDHIIHKHGQEEFIKKAYDGFQTKIRAHAAEELNPEKKAMLINMADTMIMLDVTKIPLEELNHALASSGYIGRLLTKYNIVS